MTPRRDPPHPPAARWQEVRSLARRWPRSLRATVCAAAVAGCASATLGPAPALPPLPADRTVLLLGEIHDHEAGHTARLRLLDQLLERGARPAIVMEQFDRDDQATLDAARLRTPPPAAKSLIAALRAARPGAAAPAAWNWAFYEPIVDRALRYDLPLVAANVGREDARRVMREGLAAHGFDPTVPETVSQPITLTIEASHCGMVDTPTARRMALAQVARDQLMARAVTMHAERGVVLMAGNGHVRVDVGVPRWLDAATRAKTFVVGVVEPGQPRDGYDAVIEVPEQDRPDPCAAMRRPLSPAPAQNR